MIARQLTRVATRWRPFSDPASRKCGGDYRNALLEESVRSPLQLAAMPTPRPARIRRGLRRWKSPARAMRRARSGCG